jgi:hypothetical protein
LTLQEVIERKNIIGVEPKLTNKHYIEKILFNPKKQTYRQDPSKCSSCRDSSLNVPLFRICH